VDEEKFFKGRPEGPDRESNVAFLRPYDEVLWSWRRSIRHAYTPEAIYRRFAWNTEHTYINRITPRLSRGRLNAANLRRAIIMVTRLLIRVGLLGDYRRTFWRMAWPALRAGRIEELSRFEALRGLALTRWSAAMRRSSCCCAAGRAPGPATVKYS
jgi:hypothetical protein